jgi:hypothetical protein
LLSAAAVISILAAFTWRFFYLPEPTLNGSGLSAYLASARYQSDFSEVAHAFGPGAIPYLTRQIKRDPWRESFHKATQKLPFGKSFIAADAKSYYQRRYYALYFLFAMGTNAVPALPDILKIAEAPDDPLFTTALYTLKIAPGTEFELPALKALLAATSLYDSPARSYTFERNHLYGLVSEFTAHPEIVAPALVASLQAPGGYKRIDSVVQFGTNALPALKEAALRETNHIRPATIALERILANR